MRSEQQIKNYALSFLSDQAFMTYVSFLVTIAAIGLPLYLESAPNSMRWSIGLTIYVTFSFVLRFYNEEIFKSDKYRSIFGYVMKVIDGLAMCTCLFYIPYATSSVVIFMNTILLLLCIGSAVTSAGYQPYLWAFSGPVLLIQIFVFADCFINTNQVIFGICVFLSIATVFMSHHVSKKSRILLLQVIDAQIKADRANQSKTRFFEANTHDLRQPLAASAAFLTVAMKENKDEKVDAFLVKTLDAIKVMDNQLSPMMELARIDSDNFSLGLSDVNLVSFLKETISMFSAQVPEDVKLSYVTKLNSANCKTDKELLRRCMFNLIDNSIKYTQKGSINIELSQSGSSYIVVVADTGIGINSASLNLVLDEFYQVNNPTKDPSKGFGLGLPIVHRICNKLDIKMNMESEEGKFTNVKLSIPKTIL